MEVKIGDLILDRYVIKQIMLDPKNNFQPLFFLYDKEQNEVIDWNKEKMMNILNIKEGNK